MEKPENAKVVYEFGRFVLDPNEKTLFSDGAPIRLTAKEFETLLLLVQNNGRALSKERMMASIWEDAFVDESNLAKQISRLRKILNKNGSEFIETLPKHGYRFSADLQVVEPDANDLIIAERRTVKRLRVPLPVGYEDRFCLAALRF
jgi:DNA-binding winged helix-turn-helix (wHTH) protein